MKRILIDVDTQNDFVDVKGSLYVPGPMGQANHIKNLLMSAGTDGIGETYDAVIGSVDSHAYDAWEFEENGGPFPAHCVKGTWGWLRQWPDFPGRKRFIPMMPHRLDMLGGRVPPHGVFAEKTEGAGWTSAEPRDFAREAVEKKVALYFEKEVYSLFQNPLALPVLSEIGNFLGGDWNNLQIDVIGYCTGGYCVDAAVKGLLEATSINRANIRVLGYATVPIGGDEGEAKSREELTALGAEWVEAP
jgi:nicotinamidase/pyrazinamidase